MTAAVRTFADRAAAQNVNDCLRILAIRHLQGQRPTENELTLIRLKLTEASALMTDVA